MTDHAHTPSDSEVGSPGTPAAENSPEALKQLFVAPCYLVDRVEVVEASELEIAAAIVLLKKRSKYYPKPLEVDAYPFRPEYGWRQAALNFIRKNREEQAKGRPTQL